MPRASSRKNTDWRRFNEQTVGAGHEGRRLSHVDHGSMFYASSSERQDMLKVLKEFIAEQEKEKP